MMNQSTHLAPLTISQPKRRLVAFAGSSPCFVVGLVNRSAVLDSHVVGLATKGPLLFSSALSLAHLVLRHATI